MVLKSFRIKRHVKTPNGVDNRQINIQLRIKPEDKKNKLLFKYELPQKKLEFVLCAPDEYAFPEFPEFPDLQATTVTLKVSKTQ